MNPENIKIVEIRDRATFIPALAVRMIPDGIDEKFLFNNIGYFSNSKPCILLISLEAPWSSARCSNEWRVGGRTMHEAHKWIEQNWDSIVHCQVVDVEHILKEVDKPCDSCREDEINEALENCKTEDDKARVASMLWISNAISAEEYMKKYSYLDCWVCLRKRHDQFISVIVHDISLEKGCDSVGQIMVNVKYCNDDTMCRDQAKVKSFWVKG
jgi:hypothetical protein